MRTVLAIRLDSAGDVLLAGPAIRAVAAEAARVVLLAGPRGREAAMLLPGVDAVLGWRCPWIDPEPGPARRCDVLAMASAVRRLDVERAVIFTSYHQDPPPTALVLRIAEVPHITAASEDYPGSLLNVRHRLPDSGLHEVERMLSVAGAAGFAPPKDRRMRLRSPLPSTAGGAGAASGPDGSGMSPGYVVVHPGASVPARAPAPELCAQYVAALAGEGRQVVVTGSAVRVLLWHVHGSWTSAFVQGGHEYLIPVLPGRPADGRGRSLGLSLIEAMHLGMPVVALATTEAPIAVPPAAGVLCTDPAALATACRELVADHAAARQAGLAAREHALARYGLGKFLAAWDRLLACLAQG